MYSNKASRDYYDNNPYYFKRIWPKNGKAPSNQARNLSQVLQIIRPGNEEYLVTDEWEVIRTPPPPSKK